MKNFLCNFLLHCCLFSASVVCASEAVEVEITIKDHKFNPEIIEVPRGHKIRLTVKNEDPTVEEFDSVDLNREKIIPGNSVAHIILAPLKPGKYSFVGEFHSDTATGHLIVNDN